MLGRARARGAPSRSTQYCTLPNKAPHRTFYRLKRLGRPSVDPQEEPSPPDLSRRIWPRGWGMVDSGSIRRIWVSGGGATGERGEGGGASTNIGLWRGAIGTACSDGLACWN